MSFDCCRSSGSCANPLLLNRASGSIPGAVPGSIPEEFAARDPIYFDGLVSLDEFLASTNNDLDMRPATAQESFVWPVTSRFSFVSSVFFAAMTALLLCTQVQANELQADQPLAKTSEQSSGRIISFVCGHPNTLQVLAPFDCTATSAADDSASLQSALKTAAPTRALPQGASPIAEMKYMPPINDRATTLNPRAKSLAMATKNTDEKQTDAKRTAVKQTEAKQTDTRSADRIYEKLVKLSLSDPNLYNAEAPSLITYFSILSGGQSQKRVAELEKILEKNLHSK